MIGIIIFGIHLGNLEYYHKINDNVLVIGKKNVTEAEIITFCKKTMKLI